MITRKSLIGVATLLLTAGIASADMLVWLEPATPTVNVGETVNVDILARFDSPVMAWGLDLTIADLNAIDWTATTVGPEWDQPPTTLDGDGLAGLRFPAGISGEVLLATLTFEGVAAGETLLRVSSGPEEDEGILLQAGGLATNVQFTGATLTVVPEPATALLLTLGGLALRRRS